MQPGEIKHHLKVFVQFIKASLMNRLAFRFNFIFGYLIDVGWLLFTLAFFKIFYLNVSHLAGWNYSEILVLLGTYWIYQSLIYGVAVIYNLRRLPFKIWYGDLDLYLLKPVNSQFFVSAREIWFPIFLNLIPSSILIYQGMSSLNLSFNVLTTISFLITTFSGILIVYAIWFMVVSLTFFIDKVDNLPYLPQSIIDHVTNYPVDVFGSKASFILTWFIPLAFVTSVPARVLLGQLNAVYALWGVLLAGLFLYFSHKFWNFGLKHYTSASS
jgi:ABC-2 type transport system permease protein